MSRGILPLAALSVFLLVVLVLELVSGETVPAAADVPVPAVPAVPAAAADDAAADAREALAELVQTILARPLFSQGRRAAAVAEGGGGGAAEEMPRLAGVIVAPDERRAIFVGAGDHPLVVREGGSVGRYVVRAIAPGQVTLAIAPGQADADRQQIIHPSYAKGTMP